MHRSHILSQLAILLVCFAFCLIADAQELQQNIKYYKNGSLKEKGEYTKKDYVIYRQGEWTEWYDNLQVKRKGTYCNGKKCGIWTQYRNTGELSRIVNYDKKGRRHGEQISYYPEGDTLQLAYFKHGRKHAKWQMWLHRQPDMIEYHNGAHYYERHHRNGVLLREIKFDEEGNRISFERFGGIGFTKRAGIYLGNFAKTLDAKRYIGLRLSPYNKKYGNNVIGISLVGVDKDNEDYVYGLRIALLSRNKEQSTVGVAVNVLDFTGDCECEVQLFGNDNRRIGGVGIVGITNCGTGMGIETGIVDAGLYNIDNTSPISIGLINIVSGKPSTEWIYSRRSRVGVRGLHIGVLNLVQLYGFPHFIPVPGLYPKWKKVGR